MSDMGDGFNVKQRKLVALKKKFLSGVSLDKVDGIVDEMRRLQGIPPVEWDYEPND